jgi:cell wall-associated NlpC family hydrolase
MINVLKLFVALIGAYYYTSYGQQQALIIKPVADMAVQSLQKIDPSKSVYQLYAQLPLSPNTGPYACSRAHQLLYNDRLTFLRYEGNEAVCLIPHVLYQGNKNKTINQFWTLKENIQLLSSLKHTRICTAIPDSYKDANTGAITLGNALVLLMPLYSKISKTHYSAGTRFVRAAHLDTATHYAIKEPHFSQHTYAIVHVPRSDALIAYPPTPKAKRTAIITTIRRWISQAESNNNMVIPYIWGGCSYINTHRTDNFYLQTSTRNNKNISFWLRRSGRLPSSNPHTGFDCSSLLLRITQIFGLPYFYKDSTTIRHHLCAVETYDALQPGDLIWWQGHVVLISDIQKNKVIECVGYDKGYGKLHEIELKQLFKTCDTYQKLVTAYRNHRPLERLNAQGRVIQRITHFALLKLL